MLNRFFPALLLVFAQGAHAGDYELASKMQKAGTEELALSFMRKHAPKQPDADWNALEIGLFSKFGRDREVLDVAKSLPFSKEVALLAVKAAFDLDEPEIARDWLAQMIWKGELSKVELRQARLQVVESSAKEGKDAYFAMLRFEQDYKPISKAEAGLFVRELLSAKMARNAAPWLVRLDENDPTRIRAELKTGLTSPDEAIKAAGKNPEILLEAANMKQDASLQIQAEEGLLSMGRISGKDLWESYLANAIGFSNRYALLQGESWFDSISGIADPFAARSLLAYLAVHAGNRDSKNKALGLLLDSLKDAPKIAVGLFSELPDLPAKARVILGEMAFGIGNYDRCTTFWEGIPLRSEQMPDLALAWMKTNQPKKAASVLEQYLKSMKALDPHASSHILPLLGQMVSTKEPAVGELLEAMLSLAETGTRREVLMLLGESSGNPAEAAAYYFEAATLFEKPDDLAKRAKLACIQRLKQAGFAGDAKALGRKPK